MRTVRLLVLLPTLFTACAGEGGSGSQPDLSGGWTVVLQDSLPLSLRRGWPSCVLIIEQSGSQLGGSFRLPGSETVRPLAGAVDGASVVLRAVYEGNVLRLTGTVGVDRLAGEYAIEERSSSNYFCNPGTWHAIHDRVFTDVAQSGQDGDEGAFEEAVVLYEAFGKLPVAQALLPAVRMAIESDPANLRNLKARGLRALLRYTKADEALLAKAEAFDPRNDHGILELVLQRRMRILATEEQMALLVGRVQGVVSFQDAFVGGPLLTWSAIWCDCHDQPDRARWFFEAAMARGRVFCAPVTGEGYTLTR